MDLIQCGFCHSKVRIDKIDSHLLQVHFNQDFDQVQWYIFENNLQTRFSSEVWNDNLVLAKKKKEDKKKNQNKKNKTKQNKKTKQIIVDQNKLITQQIIVDQIKENRIQQKVSDDFRPILNEIKKLKSKNYIEEAALDIIRIRSELELIFSKSFDSEPVNYRQIKYDNLKAEIEEIELNLPSKIKYINEKCETFYITWEDIKFDKNHIKINVNKGFAQPYEISGSLNVLNELKSDYFQRYYKNEIYKIITFKGVIQENISQAKGILDIKKIIQNHINKIIKSEKNDATHLENERSNFDSENIHEYLQKINYKNEFISIPAALMSQNDSAIGMLENNNGKLEECLVYIFNRNLKKIILWENTNPNRAGYLFEFDNESFDNNFTRLIDLISSQIEYKRESLFRGVNLANTFKVDCDAYYLFMHESISEYNRRLKSIVQA